VGNGVKSSFLTVDLLLSYPLLMARALRIKYKNVLYHIASRGNKRRNIFAEDHDRNFFIETLKEFLNAYREIGELMALDYSKVSVGRIKLKGD